MGKHPHQSRLQTLQRYIPHIRYINLLNRFFTLSSSGVKGLARDYGYKEVMEVKNKASKIVAVSLVFALVATFFLFTAAAASAQEEQLEMGEDKEVPSELQDKMQEFKQEAAGLKEYGTLLKSDVREFKAGMRDLMRKVRSLSGDERWELIDEVSAARDEYLGTVEEKMEAAKETAAAVKDALAAAREAWERDDLAGALSSLDGAITKVDELKARLDELHLQFQAVLEALSQLNEKAGTAPASASRTV
jgi:methyl-accepting chemotaxis protein